VGAWWGYLSVSIIVRIETEFGPIRVALDDEAAPITTTNFLHYVEEGLYDGGSFHRTVRLDNQSNENLPKRDRHDDKPLPNDREMIEVIQAGINPEREDELGDPIPLERTSETGLSHRDGTISMARTDPDSAVADFFICINDQPALDFGGMRNPDGQGFAAFGQVVEGMDIVRTIHTQPSDGQHLDPEVSINRIVREED
jgi:peptidyl-prolyl cis-trans isomerase A (cyclophilin A)